MLACRAMNDPNLLVAAFSKRENVFNTVTTVESDGVRW